MNKQELRRVFRERLTALPAADVQARSAAAVERLCAEIEFARSRTVMIFLSTPQEVDTAGIAQRAWSAKKRVVAPCVDWDACALTPVAIASLTDGLCERRFGIREPVGGAAVPIGEIELVIAPGLAFDSVGNRLGRGRGFYDRFLAQPGFRGVACGLGFEMQYVLQVPAEVLDRRLDMLVTDADVRRFPKAK